MVNVLLMGAKRSMRYLGASWKGTNTTNTTLRKELSFSGHPSDKNQSCFRLAFLPSEVADSRGGSSARQQKAAVRACRNAIEFNSIPCVQELVPGGRANMKIKLKLGVPEGVRASALRLYRGMSGSVHLHSRASYAAGECLDGLALRGRRQCEPPDQTKSHGVESEPVCCGGRPHSQAMWIWSR
jgi:hypothetical protein